MYSTGNRIWRVNKKNNYIFIFDSILDWLVFGGIATALQDRLQPPRHRLHQVPHVLGVIHLEGRSESGPRIPLI